MTDVKDTPQEVIDVWHNAEGPAGIRLRQAVRDEWPKLGKLLDACPPSDIIAAARDFETSLAARAGTKKIEKQDVREAKFNLTHITISRPAFTWLVFGTSIFGSIIGITLSKLF